MVALVCRIRDLDNRVRPSHGWCTRNAKGKKLSEKECNIGESHIVYVASEG